MAKKSKLSLEFQGIAEMAEKLEKLEGDLKAVTAKALEESHAYVTPKLHDAMRKHRRTGNTEASIVDNADVKWAGNVASIGVGFDLQNGGLPSVFLMYGTPKIKKDTTLYNAIYGTKTKKELQEMQTKVFVDAIEERMGG